MALDRSYLFKGAGMGNSTYSLFVILTMTQSSFSTYISVS